MDIFPHSALGIIGGMPCYRRDESCLRPDYQIRIRYQGLCSVSLEIVEVASVCIVSTFPGIMVMLDAGNAHCGGRSPVLPIGKGEYSVDYGGHSKESPDNERNQI